MTFSLQGWGEWVCLIVIAFRDTIPLRDLHLGSKGKKKKKYWGEEKLSKTSLPKQKCSPNAFSFSFYKKSKTEAEKSHKSKLSSRMNQWVSQEEILIVFFFRQIRPAWLAGSLSSLWPEKQHHGKVVTSRAVSEFFLQRLPTKKCFIFKRKRKKYPPSLIPPSSMSKIVSKFPGLRIRTNLKKKKKKFRGLSTPKHTRNRLFYLRVLPSVNSRRQ